MEQRSLGRLVCDVNGVPSGTSLGVGMMKGTGCTQVLGCCGQGAGMRERRKTELATALWVVTPCHGCCQRLTGSEVGCRKDDRTEAGLREGRG